MAGDADAESRRLVQAGDYGTALDLVNRVDPDGEDAKYALRRVNCLRGLGRWQQALDTVDRAAARHCGVPAIADQEVRLAILLGDFDRALTARERAARVLTPDALDALNRLIDLRQRTKAVYAPLERVYAALSDALQRRAPFALIRLGDGEGLVLSHDEPEMREALGRKLQIWFGEQAVGAAGLAEIAGGLRQAIAEADVIGAPRYQQLVTRREFVRALEAAEAEQHRRNVLVSESDMHHYLQFGGYYGHLLHGRRFLGVIGPRDLTEALKRNFEIGRVDWYPVSAETAYPGPAQGRHFPDQYKAIRDRLTVPEPGALFLVGAGVLGKVYCAWIRALGGVAVDVGSVFDGWAGVASRRRVEWAPESLSLESLSELTAVPVDAPGRTRRTLNRFGMLSDVV